MGTHIKSHAWPFEFLYFLLQLDDFGSQLRRLLGILQVPLAHLRQFLVLLHQHDILLFDGIVLFLDVTVHRHRQVPRLVQHVCPSSQQFVLLQKFLNLLLVLSSVVRLACILDLLP